MDSTIIEKCIILGICKILFFWIIYCSRCCRFAQLGSKNRKQDRDFGEIHKNHKFAIMRQPINTAYSFVSDQFELLH